MKSIQVQGKTDGIVFFSVFRTNEAAGNSVCTKSFFVFPTLNKRSTR